MNVWVMRKLSPFTVAIAVNLEPLYAILLALLIFGDSEKMSLGFYLGATVLIGSVLIDARFKSQD